MSYRILKNKSGGFHIVWDRFKNGKRAVRYVPKKEWPSLGFRSEMTVEEAWARSRQLTHWQIGRKFEERRNLINTRLRTEDTRLNSNLPDAFVFQFEREYLTRKYGDSAEGKRAQIVWRASKRVITTIDVPPEEWADTPEIFYRKFKDHTFSFDYSRRILKMMNLWGYFFCRKIGKAFLPVPPIPRKFREEIHERFHENKQGKKSKPLTPDLLEKAKSNLQVESYNWLYISLWFGLRPSEVDRLHDTSFWCIAEDDGHSVLKIYQKKLASIPMEYRWKVIPVLFPQQEKALRLIKNGTFKRPLVKTIRMHTQEKIYTYGGRKGFVRLMRSQGRSTYEISAWMGHHSLDRTRQDYEEPARLIIEQSRTSTVI